MPDATDDNTGQTASDDDKATDDPNAGAKKALAAEREAHKQAKKELAEVQRQLKELTDKDKSEVDRLREETAALTKERDDAKVAALRLEVAASKGLTPAQAKRLVGASQEELEADADEILEAFPAKGGSTPPPSRRPAADLTGGSEPSEPATEMSPAKLAEAVPRY